MPYMCGTYRHSEGDDLLHLLDILSDIHKHMGGLQYVKHLQV